ncbi:MAG TPA: hypothetical protein VHM71_05245, partial [Candidatus Deferrimicrobium sp.]|nr:hypothetical protein [Candidatus Deferrimicrobium sp.]
MGIILGFLAFGHISPVRPMVLVFWRILSMKGFEKCHFPESGGDNKATGSGTGERIVTFRPFPSPSLETKEKIGGTVMMEAFRGWIHRHFNVVLSFVIGIT